LLLVAVIYTSNITFPGASLAISFKSVVVFVSPFLMTIAAQEEFANLAMSFRSVVVFVVASTLIPPLNLTIIF